MFLTFHSVPCIFSFYLIHYFIFSLLYSLFTASYKYCPGSVLCPSCPRQVYVNVFNRSKCLGTMQTIKTDCQYHSCRKKQFRAPPLAGTYGIKVSQRLSLDRIQYRTGYKSQSLYGSFQRFSGAYWAAFFFGGGWGQSRLRMRCLTSFEYNYQNALRQAIVFSIFFHARA